MRSFYLLLLLAGLCLIKQPVSGQAMLNRMKQKLENKAADALDKAMDGKKNKPNSSTSTVNGSSPAGGGASVGSGSTYSTSTGRARNTQGEALVTTPPDVKQNLSAAETSYKAGNYAEARAAVQQAMLGVEMEIGHKILKSMPATITALKKDEATDKVTSMGFGWTGLTIQRLYKNEQDKELHVLIANNATLLAGLNLYLNNPALQSSNPNQNVKQTTLKGNKGVLEFNQSTGYKLSVPLGQSSLLVYEGINFKNEQELMAAANALDIDGIKQLLSEK